MTTWRLVTFLLVVVYCASGQELGNQYPQYIRYNENQDGGDRKFLSWDRVGRAFGYGNRVVVSSAVPNPQLLPPQQLPPPQRNGVAVGVPLPGMVGIRPPGMVSGIPPAGDPRVVMGVMQGPTGIVGRGLPGPGPMISSAPQAGWVQIERPTGINGMLGGNPPSPVVVVRGVPPPGSIGIGQPPLAVGRTPLQIPLAAPVAAVQPPVAVVSPPVIEERKVIYDSPQPSPLPLAAELPKQEPIPKAPVSYLAPAVASVSVGDRVVAEPSNSGIGIMVRRNEGDNYRKSNIQSELFNASVWKRHLLEERNKRIAKSKVQFDQLFKEYQQLDASKPPNQQTLANNFYKPDLLSSESLDPVKKNLFSLNTAIAQLASEKLKKEGVHNLPQLPQIPQFVRLDASDKMIEKLIDLAQSFAPNVDLRDDENLEKAFSKAIIQLEPANQRKSMVMQPTSDPYSNMYKIPQPSQELLKQPDPSVSTKENVEDLRTKFLYFHKLSEEQQQKLFTGLRAVFDNLVKMYQKLDLNLFTKVFQNNVPINNQTDGNDALSVQRKTGLIDYNTDPKLGRLKWNLNDANEVPREPTSSEELQISTLPAKAATTFNIKRHAIYIKRNADGTFSRIDRPRYKLSSDNLPDGDSFIVRNIRFTEKDPEFRRGLLNYALTHKSKALFSIRNPDGSRTDIPYSTTKNNNDYNDSLEENNEEQYEVVKRRALPNRYYSTITYPQLAGFQEEDNSDSLLKTQQRRPHGTYRKISKIPEINEDDVLDTFSKSGNIPNKRKAMFIKRNSDGTYRQEAFSGVEDESEESVDEVRYQRKSLLPSKKSPEKELSKLEAEFTRAFELIKNNQQKLPPSQQPLQNMLYTVTENMNDPSNPLREKLHINAVIALLAYDNYKKLMKGKQKAPPMGPVPQLTFSDSPEEVEVVNKLHSLAENILKLRFQLRGLKGVPLEEVVESQTKPNKHKGSTVQEDTLRKMLATSEKYFNDILDFIIRQQENLPVKQQPFQQKLFSMTESFKDPNHPNRERFTVNAVIALLAYDKHKKSMKDTKKVTPMGPIPQLVYSDSLEEKEAVMNLAPMAREILDYRVHLHGIKGVDLEEIVKNQAGSKKDSGHHIAKRKTIEIPVYEKSTWYPGDRAKPSFEYEEASSENLPYRPDALYKQTQDESGTDEYQVYPKEFINQDQLLATKEEEFENKVDLIEDSQKNYPPNYQAFQYKLFSKTKTWNNNENLNWKKYKINAIIALLAYDHHKQLIEGLEDAPPLGPIPQLSYIDSPEEMEVVQKLMSLADDILKLRRQLRGPAAMDLEEVMKNQAMPTGDRKHFFLHGC